MIVLNHGGVVRRARGRRARPRSASIRRRWPPRDRSTSSARSRSSTPTPRAWAGSMETVRRTIQLAHVMTRWRGSEVGRATRPADDGDRRRQRARAPLPGQGDHRAGDHARHRRPRRVARGRAGWPTSSSGSPAYFGVEARARDQGRPPGLGAARRGQRDGRARRADALRDRLGRMPGAGRRPRRCIFVSAGVRRCGLGAAIGAGGRSIVPVGRTARADARATRPQPRHGRRSRSIPATAGSPSKVGRSRSSRPRGAAQSPLPAALSGEDPRRRDVVTGRHDRTAGARLPRSGGASIDRRSLPVGVEPPGRARLGPRGDDLPARSGVGRRRALGDDLERRVRRLVAAPGRSLRSRRDRAGSVVWLTDPVEPERPAMDASGS